MLGLALRVLVTAAGIALPTLLSKVPLPGLALDGADPFAVALEHSGGALSVGALGLDSVLLAFVLVEIVARLVPRFRQLRHGKGRQRLLRATFGIAAVLLLAQALFLGWALRSYGTYDLFTEGLGPMLLDAGAALLGSVALLVTARAVTRWGTGHGLSVVAVLGAVPFWIGEASLASGGDDPEAFARTLLLTGFAGVLFLGRDVGGERLPVAGLLPLLMPSWGAQIASLAGFWISLEWLQWLFSPSFTGVIGVVAVLAVGLSVWAERDRSLANVKARVPAIAASALIPLAILVGDRAIALDTSFIGGGSGLCFFVLALACSLDVLREASLRSSTALVPILAFSEIRVVDAVGRRLSEADVPFVMRGALHRTLLRFFGPWVPVKLLVPVERAQEARELARNEAQREAYEEIIDAF